MSSAADIQADDPSDDSRREVSPRRLVIVILGIVSAIVFAWSIWAAVGNLIQVPALFGQYRDFVTQGGAPELAKSTPWPALVAALVLPALGWGAAWWLGRGRGLRARLVFLLVAYAAVCALTVSLTGYVFQVSSLL